MDPTMDPQNADTMNLNFSEGEGEGEGQQESFYIGSYRTREEAEAGLLEKDRTISRLMNETNQVRGEEARIARLMEAFAAEPNPPAYNPGVQPSASQPFPWEQQLPDPVEQPEQFKAALARQIATADERAYQRIRAESQRQAQSTAQIDRLWEYFQGAYPDLADKQELVAAAWIQRTGGQVPRDPRMLPSILADVATSARGAFQRYTGQAPGQGPQSFQGGQETRTFVPAKGRSTMASGFQGGPGQAGGQQSGGDNKPLSFTEELKDYQRKQGYR